MSTSCRCADRDWSDSAIEWSKLTTYLLDPVGSVSEADSLTSCSNLLPEPNTGNFNVAMGQQDRFTVMLEAQVECAQPSRDRAVYVH